MNHPRLLSTLLDFGEAMLGCGAEIYRVEDTLSRLGVAYGAVSTDVFVITSSIVMTLTFSEDDSATMSRRMNYSGGTDFSRLEALNALSRRCCAAPMDLPELKKELDVINAKPVSGLLLYAASFLSSGAFAIFFGGTIADGILAALLGLLCNLIMKALPRLVGNKTFFYLVCSALNGILIYLLGTYTNFFHMDKVAIGVVMLLIPGITTTNAVRDMLTGDTISGSLKLIQCIIWAMMIACGFALAIFITGADTAHTATTDSYLQLIPAMLGAMGFAMLFNLRWKYMPYACLGGLACWAVFLLFELQLGVNIFWCSMISAFVADFLAHILARLLKTPSTLFLIPLVVPMIPGGLLYYTSISLVSSNTSEFWKYGLTTVLIVMGISFGIGFSSNLFNFLLKRPQIKKN